MLSSISPHKFRMGNSLKSLRNIGGSLSASEPVSSSSGPLWGGAVSAFDRVRKALVDGKNHEAGVLDEADSSFRAAETRGSGRVPDRVKDAFHRAQARLKVAERSLRLIGPDFDRIPQGGDYLGSAPPQIPRASQAPRPPQRRDGNQHPGKRLGPRTHHF